MGIALRRFPHYEGGLAPVSAIRASGGRSVMPIADPWMAGQAICHVEGLFVNESAPVVGGYPRGSPVGSGEHLQPALLRHGPERDWLEPRHPVLEAQDPGDREQRVRPLERRR
jgi:hypothetical protein